jgi:hypothetical protein
MHYRITLKATHTSNPFNISFPAANRIKAKQEAINMYPDHIIVAVNPGRCLI